MFCCKFSYGSLDVHLFTFLCYGEFTVIYMFIVLEVKHESYNERLLLQSINVVCCLQ